MSLILIPLARSMEKDFWKEEIINWSNRKRAMKPFQKDLIRLFEVAFNNTRIPERTLFGTRTTGISILVGNIYLLACHSSDTISILLDRPITDINNTAISVAKSAKNFEHPLYWFETRDLTVIDEIISKNDLWESYYHASYKIF